MKQFALVDFNNSQGFVIRVSDADYEKAKQLALEGYARWMDVETYPEYHDVGYAEPAEELLTEAGIVYEEDAYFDEYDEVLPQYEDTEIIEY